VKNPPALRAPADFLSARVFSR